MQAFFVFCAGRICRGEGWLWIATGNGVLWDEGEGLSLVTAREAHLCGDRGSLWAAEGVLAHRFVDCFGMVRLPPLTSQ